MPPLSLTDTLQRSDTMQTKTKRVLVVAGGAGVAYLFLSRSGLIGSLTPSGSVSGTGAVLTPESIITNPIETITETLPKILTPIIKPSTPYVGSKKFYKDVDLGIFGDTEFYAVGTIDAAEQARRKAEIAASKKSGGSIWGGGSSGGSGWGGGWGDGGGSGWGSWSGDDSFNITPADIVPNLPEYLDPLSGGGGGMGGGGGGSSSKKTKKSTKSKKKYRDGKGGYTSKPGQPD